MLTQCILIFPAQGDFSLPDLQLPLFVTRSATPTHHLSDPPTPTTDVDHYASNPILEPPERSGLGGSDAIRQRATDAARAAEQHQQQFLRRMRLSEQRFAFPARGDSLEPASKIVTASRFSKGFKETLEIAVGGLRQIEEAPAPPPEFASPPPAPTRELSETYSLTPIDLYATPAKAAAILGLFPMPLATPSYHPGARLMAPQPLFMSGGRRARTDSNASASSSVASYLSSCWPSRPSLSSSRTQTSVAQAAVANLGSCGSLSSPRPFEALLPCGRDAASPPDTQGDNDKESLSSATPPPRPARNPNRPNSGHLVSHRSAAQLRKPSPLARRTSLGRAPTQRTSTTDLQRIASGNKRGVLGPALRSASQSDLLDPATAFRAGFWSVGDVQHASPSTAQDRSDWYAPSAWEVVDCESQVPPTEHRHVFRTRRAERRLTRRLWEEESERLRLKMSGVGGGLSES